VPDAASLKISRVSRLNIACWNWVSDCKSSSQEQLNCRKCAPKCQNTILGHKLIESSVTETTLAKIVNAQQGCGERQVSQFGARLSCQTNSGVRPGSTWALVRCKERTERTVQRLS
jgi:hypothetical protein